MGGTEWGRVGDPASGVVSVLSSIWLGWLAWPKWFENAANLVDVADASDAGDSSHASDGRESAACAPPRAVGRAGSERNCVFMGPLCHEFRKDVSLGNASWL